MYKVLLADDEMLDLEGIRKFIPWSELGMEVAASVTNGLAALEVLSREPIDILVTDVRMPHMSGLELARQSLDRQKGLRIIFVSGHQDFDYVKQALSLNACSYVLKPMDDAEMIASLKKLRAELDEELKRRKNEQAFMQMKPIIHNEYLTLLLEGEDETVDMQAMIEAGQMEPIRWPVHVAVLEIDDLSWKLNPYPEVKRKELLNGYVSEVFALCKAMGIQHACKINRQRLGLLIDPYVEMDLALQQILEHVERSFPFTVTIGLGGAAIDALTLQESYREALSALEYKMFVGKGKQINYKNLQTNEIEDAKKLDTRLDSLFEAMNRYDLVRIHDEIERLFQLGPSMRSRFTVHNFAMYVILKLDGYLQTLNEDLFQILGMELQNLDILLQFETISDIRAWLRKRMFEISESLHQKKKRKNARLIREITDYVQEHLSGNITLRDVADRFSFSPNYLGTIFKDGTGQNFSEFVIGYRMEKARALLKESSLKIYEVADRVGYRYLPYFSKQFKETYGMTPVEYKRNQ